jgi:hypothetical protein
MSDLKNAAAGSVEVSEGVVSKVGTRGGPRGPRRPKPVNTRALQAAVNRAEINGPLASLGKLYLALAADVMYNVNSDGVGPIAKRLKAGIEAGVTIQTVAAPKGRLADPDKATNDGITEECADELRIAYAHFADPNSMETFLDAAKDGKKRYMKFFAMLDRFVNGGEEVEPTADVLTEGQPVPA